MLIPDGPQALTSEWLTQALRKTGIIKNATVSSFHTQPLGEEGEGTTGQLARVALTYEHTESGAPKTLIAKFHSADPAVRNFVNSLGMYKSEYQFYEHIASQIETPASRCYYCDYQDDGTTVLLLEDLAPARSLGSNLDSSHVELAVRNIAKFQAYWWEHTQLDEILGMEEPKIIQGVWTHLQNQVQQNWPIVVELAKDNLMPGMKEIGERIVYKWNVFANDLYYQAPRTIIHGDYHADNFLFATQEGGAPFTIIDWQLCKRGRGAYDIGMLLGGLPVEQRRNEEQALLKMYYQILIENGIKEYSFEQCFDDYRLTLLDTFARLVYVIRPPLQNEDLERYHASDHKFREVELPRRCAAILDLGADKLIPE